MLKEEEQYRQEMLRETVKRMTVDAEIERKVAEQTVENMLKMLVTAELKDQNYFITHRLRLNMQKLIKDFGREDVDVDKVVKELRPNYQYTLLDKLAGSFCLLGSKYLPEITEDYFEGVETEYLMISYELYKAKAEIAKKEFWDSEEGKKILEA